MKTKKKSAPKKVAKRKNKPQSILLSKEDKVNSILKKREKRAKKNKQNPEAPKLNPAKKTSKAKPVFKNTTDIILISIDRNWLAKRSQELSQIMTRNNIRDPKLQDGNLLSETLMCKGANDQILEILDKYDNV